jgi:DNA polymerase-3 subunit epsilon
VILNQPIDNLPIAVIDFETTGLYAGPDRVVEAAVVRIEPGGEPTLAFDSLIRPDRPVGATFIHGITESDVADAPTFGEIAGEFVRAMSGCIIAAYNASFDMSFLRAELATVGIRHTPPHMCLMYLRQLLDVGKICKLGIACRAHGIRLHGAHSAAGDALATADLWFHYLPAMEAKKVRTYGDLARLKPYQFTKSFDRAPLPADLAEGRPGAPTKSRFRGALT